MVGPEPANYHLSGSISGQWSPPGVARTDVSVIMHQSSIPVRPAKAEAEVEALMVSTAQSLTESGILVMVVWATRIKSVGWNMTTFTRSILFQLMS